MSNSRPLGALGGGGWEASTLSGAATGGRPANHPSDKVLVEMFDMFLDSMEAEIIQSVVQSCNYNREKSMENLLAMCGNDSSTRPLPAANTQPFNNECLVGHPKESSKSLSCIEPTRGTGKSIEVARSDVGTRDSLTNQQGGAVQFTCRAPEVPKMYSTAGSVTANQAFRPSFPSRTESKSSPDASTDKMKNIRWYIENQQKILVIMRGCPGSGKTYLAKGLIESYGGNPQDYVFSTDDFFMRNNNYLFNPNQLPEAHEWNQKRVLDKMRDGCSPIIIDNTNTQLWEMNVYANLAISNGYAIEILEPHTPWFNKLGELLKRNTHQVPRENLKRMLERYESGITVEALIKSTNAKYSKIPPQPAKLPLHLHHSRPQQMSKPMDKPGISKQNVVFSSFPASISSGSNILQSFGTRDITSKVNTSSDKDVSKNDPGKPYLQLQRKLSEQNAPCFGPVNSTLVQPDRNSFKFLPESSQKENLSLNAFQFSETNESEKFKSVLDDYMMKSKQSAGMCSPEENWNLSLSSLVSSSPLLETQISAPSNAANLEKIEKSIDNISSMQSNHQKKDSEVLNFSQKGATLNTAVMSPQSLEDGKVSRDEKDGLESIVTSGDFTEHSEVNTTGNVPKDLKNCFADVNASANNLLEHPSAGPSSQFSVNTSSYLKEINEPLGKPTSLTDKPLSEKEVQDGLPENSSEKIITFNSISPNVVDMMSPKSLQDDLIQTSRISEHISCKEFVRKPSLIAENLMSWDKEKCVDGETRKENSTLNPLCTLSSESIENYCKTVKDMNEAAQNEASSWSICEKNILSWQPIDEIHEAKSSPQRVPQHIQRSKFRKCDVSEMGTNTHHMDFLILKNLSLNDCAKDIIILEACDRDINQGVTSVKSEVPLKLMLDKGTSTEDSFETNLTTENKLEKVKELSRLFPNRSPASLKELLKQCKWDVNYVSNLLLDDTDNGSSCNSFMIDGSSDSDSDLEASNEDESDKNTSFSTPTTMPNDATFVTNHEDEIVSSKEAAEEVKKQKEEVKKYIEQSIDFNTESYSPHLLSIKNFRKGLREGAIPKASPVPMETSAVFNESTSKYYPPEPLQDQPLIIPEERSSDDDVNENLELVVGQDFIQQLVDKFGAPLYVAKKSHVVKFPVQLARQIYDVIFSSEQDEEDDDCDFASKLQCEEDERMARQLYEEMLCRGEQLEQTTPQLREIMDMELAQAIYKADLDSLPQNSQETMARVLAKRLLEDNYSQIDKKTLHDIFASCNYSFEDTVKTLQEALSNDKQVFSESGRAHREQGLLERAKQASVQHPSDSKSDHMLAEAYECATECAEEENPWESSDPNGIHIKYRQKADEFLKARGEMYRKANEAFRQNQRSVAAYYAKLGELNNKKYHDANAMAAAALAALHTNAHSIDILDLHHYKVAEATEVFDMFLDYHIRHLFDSGQGHETLTIITGRGQHSVNGKPRIKPAIVNRARKRRLRVEEMPNNPGVVRVFVKKDSTLTSNLQD